MFSCSKINFPSKDSNSFKIQINSQILPMRYVKLKLQPNAVTGIFNGYYTPKCPLEFAEIM